MKMKIISTFVSTVVSLASFSQSKKCVIETTYRKALYELETNNLQKGFNYYLADKDINIYATHSNLFCLRGCRTMRIVKNSMYTGGTIGMIQNHGVWQSSIMVSVGDVAIWGGKVWSNVSGHTGSSPTDLSLSSDWQEVSSTNNEYYTSKSFVVLYDFINDWVLKQYDDRGNEMGLAYDPSLAFNPVDISDWGDQRIRQNKCSGIYNNSGQANIFLNNMVGSISSNSTTVEISVNTCDSIVSNLCKVITRNRNSGSIYSNGCMNIVGNSNNGDIGVCSNSGDISDNSCNGKIFGIGNSVVNIFNNDNNGHILITISGDISEPTLNK